MVKMYLNEFEASGKYLIALGPSSTYLLDNMVYNVPMVTKSIKSKMSKGQLKKVKPGQDGNFDWIFRPNQF